MRTRRPRPLDEGAIRRHKKRRETNIVGSRRPVKGRSCTSSTGCLLCALFAPCIVRKPPLGLAPGILDCPYCCPPLPLDILLTNGRGSLDLSGQFVPIQLTGSSFKRNRVVLAFRGRDRTTRGPSSALARHHYDGSGRPGMSRTDIRQRP